MAPTGADGFHTNTNTNHAQKRHSTRDGPAIEFNADPLLFELPPYVDYNNETHQNEDETLGSQFGLVFVAGWPPPSTIISTTDINMNINESKSEDNAESKNEIDFDYIRKYPYQKFQNHIKECFNEGDCDSESQIPPAVYLYPPECLHITIATLHQPSLPKPSSLAERNFIKNFWNTTMEKASQHPDWPNHSMKLRISSAQIGKSAGILLWDETTGGLDAIRICLRETIEQAQYSPDSFEAKLAENLSIPLIVHTTFLRFSSKPEADGIWIQTQFSQHVLPYLNAFFSKEVIVKNAAVVCETIPYMHIPNDSNHVLQTFSFPNE